MILKRITVEYLGEFIELEFNIVLHLLFVKTEKTTQVTESPTMIQGSLNPTIRTSEGKTIQLKKGNIAKERVRKWTLCILVK